MREREKTEERGRSSAGAAAAGNFQQGAACIRVRSWALVGWPVWSSFRFFLSFF
jgi:hypothetical protein